MTDTLKRLAGPTAPVQKSAGTSLYNPAGGVTAAVKSMLVHNTDPLMGAFLWLGVNDLTDMTKRLYSGLYIPAGDTLYVPLDIVLTSADTLYARQASVVDPASINFSTGVTPAQVGSASSVTSGTWTEVNGAAYVACVMQRHASAVGTVTGFTDTHTGISWTLMNTVVNSLNTVRTSLYRAISTGTTNTTTQVSFSQTEAGSAIYIVQIVAAQSLVDGTTSILSTSGTNADDVVQARGEGYFIGTNLTPLYQYDEVNPNGIFFGVGAGSAENQTAITGVTELTDSSLATALLTITASYMQAPMTWLKPTVGTGSTGRTFCGCEVITTKRALNVILDGVEVS